MIQKIINRLTGEVQLQKADRILKEVLLECEETEYREKINRARKIIRRYRENQKKKILILRILLCTGVAIFLIRAGAYLAGDCILGTDEFFAWDTGFNAYYERYGGEYFLENVRDTAIMRNVF